MRRLLSLAVATALFACEPTTSTPDSGTPPADAGSMSAIDAGATAGTDAGSTPTDAGAMDPDAGTMPADGGATATDAGTTPDVDAGPPWTPATYTTWNASSTRLQARAVVDGNQNGVITWFDDTALNVRCTVRPAAADGLRYCLPEAMDVEAFGGAVFSDAACTALALHVRPNCKTEKYATWRNAALYAATELTASTYYVDQGGTCTAVALPANERLLGLALADLSTFVAFPTESDVAPGADAGVGVRVAASVTGASTAIGLLDRATGRPARAVELQTGTDASGAPTFETRVIPENPWPFLPISYYRYDCAVTDLRFANAFVADAVTPAPAFVQVGILPAHLTPGSSPYRKVTSTQSTYCDAAGNVQTVGPTQLVYVLGGPAADLSQQPRLTRRVGVGPGTNLAHYLTADGTPLVPVAALDQGAELFVGTRPVRLAAGGGLPVAVPTSALQPSWAQVYADAACATPAALASEYAVGDLLARVIRSELPAGACQKTLPGAPAALESLWSVSAATPTTGHPYAWVSFGPGQQQCESTGQSSGGPPPPPVEFRPTTDVTAQAGTLLPVLSTTQL